MLSSEAAHRFDPTLGENTNHYTTDAALILISLRYFKNIFLWLLLSYLLWFSGWWQWWQLMKRLSGATSNKVGIYHYATVKCTQFRDNSIEENTMREKASVVKINNIICKDRLCYFVLLNKSVNRIFSVRMPQIRISPKLLIQSTLY